MNKYFVLINGQQQGPFEESAVRDSYRAGTYTGRTLVWCKGMEKWQHLESVAAFMDDPDVPPPPPAQEDAPPAPPVAAAPSIPVPPPPPAPPAASVTALSVGDALKAKWDAFMAAKPWKKLNRQQYNVLGGIFGATLILIVVLLFIFHNSYSSDEDVIRFLDRRIEKKAPAGMKRYWGDKRESVIATLKNGGDTEQDLKNRLFVCEMLATLGEKDALVYLFEKKGVEPKIADRIVRDAALFGHCDVVEYLVKKQCSGDAYYLRKAMKEAIAGGHVKVCRFLVKEAGVEVSDDSIISGLLQWDKREYDRNAKYQNDVLGDNLTGEEMMDKVAEIAEFLIKEGAKTDTRRVREALGGCPNAKLREVIKAAKK